MPAGRVPGSTEDLAPRADKHGWLKELRSAKDLTDREFRLLVILGTFARADLTAARPSRQTLAECLGCSSRTVTNTAQHLEAKGYLTPSRNNRGGRGQANEWNLTTRAHRVRRIAGQTAQLMVARFGDAEPVDNPAKPGSPDFPVSVHEVDETEQLRDGNRATPRPKPSNPDCSGSGNQIKESGKRRGPRTLPGAATGRQTRREQERDQRQAQIDAEAERVRQLHALEAAMEGQK